MYTWIIVDITSPCKYVILHFLFYHCLLVEVSQSFYIISLIVWLVLVVLDCKNCLKVDVVLISIKLNTRFHNLMNPNMDIPTTQEIILLRLMIYAIAFFFSNVCGCIVHSFVFFVSKICSDSFRNSSVWNRRIVFFQEIVHLAVGFFFSRIHRLCHCMYFLLMVIFY